MSAQASTAIRSLLSITGGEVNAFFMKLYPWLHQPQRMILSLHHIATSLARGNRGRPLGANNSKRKISEFATIVTKNGIALKYSTKKKEGNKRLKPGRLHEIIELVTRRNKLGNDVKITEACIR